MTRAFPDEIVRLGEHVPKSEPDYRALAVQLADIAEAAWGIIANANHGVWEGEEKVWQVAAASWRDRYHAAIDAAREGGANPVKPADVAYYMLLVIVFALVIALAQGAS